MVKGTVAAGEFSRTYVQAKASAEKSAAGGKGGPRFYPADDVKVPIAKKIVNKPTKLRASITPGTVLILLSGRFKGKRVVYLKQLPSGLLLVSGPYKVNGVPVRRVNQTYVIATSTKVKLPALDLAKFDDAYFKAAEKKQKNTKTEGDFMETEEAKKELAAEYLASQKAVDDALAGALSEEMKGYLGDLFSLNDGDRPHLMKF